MNLHEYQAKQLFADYGLPVPSGIPCSSADEAVAATKKLGGDKWVVKCQVHAGGRGKAGGVKIVSTKQAIEEAVIALLGTRLVTFQTDEKGQPVKFERDEVKALLKQAIVKMDINLNSGKLAATAWGCDLSRKYVDINTEYS